MDIGVELSLTDILTKTDPHIKAIKNFYFNYLAKPHPNLGRSGAVCPFVPLALKFEKITSLLIASETTIEQVKCILMEKAEFMETQSKDSAFVLFLPNFSPSDIDTIQIQLKPLFVSKGLMVGEFHSSNTTPGIHNQSFFPLRSDIPCLAIRHMIKEDMPFMLKNSYTTKQTMTFLLFYFKKFPDELLHLRAFWVILVVTLLILFIAIVIKFW